MISTFQRMSRGSQTKMVVENIHGSLTLGEWKRSFNLRVYGRSSGRKREPCSSPSGQRGNTSTPSPRFRRAALALPSADAAASSSPPLLDFYSPRLPKKKKPPHPLSPSLAPRRRHPRGWHTGGPALAPPPPPARWRRPWRSSSTGDPAALPWTSGPGVALASPTPRLD